MIPRKKKQEHENLSPLSHSSLASVSLITGICLFLCLSVCLSVCLSTGICLTHSLLTYASLITDICLTHHQHLSLPLLTMKIIRDEETVFLPIAFGDFLFSDWEYFSRIRLYSGPFQTMVRPRASSYSRIVCTSWSTRTSYK